MQIAVVVPTREEAASIAELCAGVRRALPEARIIVVDAASADGTAAEASRADAGLGGVTVVDQGAEHGLGAAYRQGFRIALDDGADICVQIDADLSHDPADLPALVDIVNAGADLAIGSRYVPGGRTLNWPRRRRVLSRWGNRVAAGVLGLAINDATAGLRAYRATALETIEYASVPARGYGVQVEMTHRIVSHGGRVVEFPITFHERRRGRSKLSVGIVVEAARIVVRLWVADRSGRRARRRSGG